MKLILFRHGPAWNRDASAWPDDAARPLTEVGRERTLAAANGLIDMVGDLKLILTSPFVRAAQTAQILSEVVPGVRIETTPALRPGGSSDQAIQRLRSLESGGNVALVGHEPDLGSLAGALVFGGTVALPMKKAGACVIDFVGPIEAGTGQLIAFYPPRALRHLAGKRSKA